MKVYLAQPWGGLGDNLQFTTLPKLYHDNGYECYLSSQNVCRNSEIFDFVWKNNPYIKGVVDHPPTIGANAPDLPLKTIDNIISSAELRHGFPATNRYADVYYEPKLISDLHDKVIVDLSAATLFNVGIEKYYNMDTLFNLVSENIPKENVKFVQFSKVDFAHLSGGFEFENNVLMVDSIFDYADFIHSCKEYYCLYSGGNIMSSAIKHKYNSKVNITCFLHGTLQEHLDRGYFVFDNVKYIDVV
jgi:hypothetical protein